MAKESAVDSVNCVEAMFTSSGDIGAQCTEDVGPVFSPKAAGVLLLDFYHAYIAFDQVVVKRDAEVIHEG